MVKFYTVGRRARELVDVQMEFDCTVASKMELFEAKLTNIKTRRDSKRSLNFPVEGD